MRNMSDQGYTLAKALEHRTLSDKFSIFTPQFVTKLLSNTERESNLNYPQVFVKDTVQYLLFNHWGTPS